MTFVQTFAIGLNMFVWFIGLSDLFSDELPVRSGF
jgi:hypothetical protein